MPEDPMVRAAQHLASAAHRGQVDKAGRDYIDHPRRVAAAVAAHADPAWLAEAQAAAWLHDVLEDTEVTADQLRADFPLEVVRAVQALTRRAGQDPDEYYAGVKADPIALAVKHADLDDNTDPDRLALLDTATRQRLLEKYRKARAALR